MLQLLFPPGLILVTCLGTSNSGPFPRVQAGGQRRLHPRRLGKSQQGVVQRSLGIRGVKTVRHQVHREGGSEEGGRAQRRGSQATEVVQDPRHAGIAGDISQPAAG